MTTSLDYQDIRPFERNTLYELLLKAGFDLSAWNVFKAGSGHPASNPKYCYNWSFQKPGKEIATCLWHAEISADGATLFHANNMRAEPVSNNAVSLHVWKRRATEFDVNVRTAYLNRLPIRAVILDGKRRDRTNPSSRASSVKLRLLDPKPWAVTEYDFTNGDFVLTRGIGPVVPFTAPTDPEIASFKEGALRKAFRAHRHRETRARAAKIAEVLKRDGGQLRCEVPRCGFDFHARYGAIGEGYAHVHHLKPLGWSPGETETKLSDLAVVCPNCHAMIHIGGECRDMATLIA